MNRMVERLIKSLEGYNPDYKGNDYLAGYVDGYKDAELNIQPLKQVEPKTTQKVQLILNGSRKHKKWKHSEVDKLYDLLQEGYKISKIAKQLDRTPAAIRSQMTKLGFTKEKRWDK